jgi:hypothetical protein
MPNSPDTDLQGNPVALWRRLAAMLYDTLAVIGICFVVGGIAVGLNHGVAVPANHPGFSALLLLLNYLYFAFCWRRSGQTLMQFLELAHLLRAGALGRAAGRCQLCGVAGNLNVHHNTYKRRGAELPSDVIALCRSCHAKFHGKAPR